MKRFYELFLSALLRYVRKPSRNAAVCYGIQIQASTVIQIPVHSPYVLIYLLFILKGRNSRYPLKRMRQMALVYKARSHYDLIDAQIRIVQQLFYHLYPAFQDISLQTFSRTRFKEFPDVSFSRIKPLAQGFRRK